MRLAEPFHSYGEHLAVELPGARAVFTTRRGGFSAGPYASLNLGRWTDDDPDAVERNRKLIAERLNVRLLYGRQVHGSRVRRTRSDADADNGGVLSEADGQATAVSGLGAMVLTADCLPIAIAGSGAAAMLHAGWRGLAAGVIEEGVAAVRKLGAAGRLEAAIGPGAGRCCYEVSDEVGAVFAGYGPDVRNGKNLDLGAIARLALERAGVARVHDVGLCTICADQALFFSHRRDGGLTGRQAGIAWLN